MGILGFDATPFVISIAAALIVGGAIFIYMRARISDLERSHMEQARVLRTFIAQQQQHQHMIAHAPPTTACTAPPQTNLNAATVVAPAEGPKERILVSEDGSNGESDLGSEYETDSVSDSIVSELSDVSSTHPTADLETRVIELSGILQAEVLPDIEPAVIEDSPDYHKMKVDPLRVLALEMGLLENMEQGKKLRKPALISLLVGEIAVDKTGIIELGEGATGDGDGDGDGDGEEA